MAAALRVAEAVELTLALGRLPSRLVLIGVEAGTLEGAGRSRRRSPPA